MKITHLWTCAPLAALAITLGGIPVLAAPASETETPPSDAPTIVKDIVASEDTTLQAWRQEKTQSNSAKPYIGALHPARGGAQAPGQTYGLFGEGFVSADTSDGTDAKMGLITFNLTSLAEAPRASVVEVTYIGHRVNNVSPTEQAEVGLALVDTARCTNSAATCPAETATWATRPDFSLSNNNDVVTAQFPYAAANLYTSDSMTIAADKRATVSFDVTNIVNAAFQAGKKVLTFALGDMKGREVRFASTEATGSLRGLSEANLPTLKVTVPKPVAPTGPRAWDEQSAAMATHDVLWYDKPASRTPRGWVGTAGVRANTKDDQWQRSTLPIGNGKLGGTVWGEISAERITFNEETLWTGGPGPNRSYEGGNDVNRGRNGAALRELNAELDTGKTTVRNPGNLTGGFDAQSQGSFQSWGELNLASDIPLDADIFAYERALDLNTGIASVHFNYANTDYMREYFVSNPDDVMVLRLTAEGDQKLNTDVALPLHTGWTRQSEQVTIDNGTLTSSGVLRNNGLLYNAKIKAVVEGEGATVGASDAGDALSVKGATALTLYIAAATDYKQVYPTYRTGEDAQALDQRLAKAVNAAATKGYDAVRAAHIADHSALYDRVDIELGQAPSYGGEGTMTTDALLSAYKNDTLDEAHKRTLEMLIYDYGRYMTIASSRANSQLPSNLQGIWSSTADDRAHGATPWGADFHLNVNLQMNYWPTYSANLAESAMPLIDYVEGLVEPGRVTAKVYAGASTPAGTPIGEGQGFMAHTENTAYGWTTPGLSFSWGWSPAAVPWILQNVYEYYEYTGDEKLLRERIYPLLKEEANFYVNYMLKKGNRPAGDGKERLTTGVAYSPEHGPMGTDGNTYESSLVWQLLQDVQEAAKILGVDANLVSSESTCSVENWAKTGDSFTSADANRTWACAQSLLSPIEVGDSGQIKEWFFEGELGKDSAGAPIPGYQGGHRHLSHMLGLFPGDLITVDNSAFMDAAKVSLNTRGDDATGWGVGQRINSWARTGDGDRAYLLITKQLKNAMYPNLFDAHPPFQIDGNFGNTSGVNEMLVQSNSTFVKDGTSYHNYINLLPALPTAWAEGQVTGLKTRGDFTINMRWDEGQVDELVIHSNKGGPAVLSFDGAASFLSAQTEDGTKIRLNKIDDTHVSFPTKAGMTYILSDEDAGLDLTALTQAVTDAKAALKAARVSEDGSDVLPADQWVLQADYDALEASLSRTEAALANKGAGLDQAGVNSLVAAARKAIEGFAAAAKPGTKTEPKVEPEVEPGTDQPADQPGTDQSGVEKPKPVPSSSDQTPTAAKILAATGTYAPSLAVLALGLGLAGLVLVRRIRRKA